MHGMELAPKQGHRTLIISWDIEHDHHDSKAIMTHDHV